MEQELVEELLEVGEIETLTDLIPEGTITVKEAIAELGLDGYWAVLVNDKPANDETLITPQSKVVIIPQLAGG